MKSIKIFYFPHGETEQVSEVNFEILRCHETYDKEEKELFLTVENTIPSDKLQAIAAGIIDRIVLTDLEDDVIFVEYNQVKSISRQYFNKTANANELTSIVFAKKYFE